MNAPDIEWPRRGGRGEALALAGLVVLTVLPAFLAHPFPSQDGPLHSASAFIFSRIDDPGLGFGRYLEANVPLSGQGWAFLLIGLDQLLPFAVAERVALALLLAAFPLAGLAWARLTGRAALPAAAILCLVAHSWMLAMGFWSFMLGMALAPLACAVAHRLADRGPTVWRVLGLAASLLGIAWIHAFAAVLGGALAGVAALGALLEGRRRGAEPVGAQAEARPRLGPRELALRLGLVALAGAPALAYVLGVSRGFSQAPSASPGGTLFEPFITRLADAFRLGPGALCTVTGLVFACAAGWVVVQAARERTGAWTTRLFALAAGVLLLGFLVTPIRAEQWAFLSPRLLFGGMVALGLAGLVGPRSRWARFSAMAAVAVGLCASTAALVRATAELAPLVDVVERLARPRGGTFVPLQFAPERMKTAPRYVDLTIHLGAHAVIASGGITPHLFAHNPAVHVLRFREDLVQLVGHSPPPYGYLALQCSAEEDERRCTERRRRYADRIALSALPWGELVVFHPPPALLERLVVRGYEHRGGTEVAQHWRARPAWLELPGRADVHVARLQLLPELAWLSLERGQVLAGSTRLSRVGPLPAGLLRIGLFPVRAGEVAAEPAWVSPSFELAPGSVRRITAAAADAPPPR